MHWWCTFKQSDDKRRNNYTIVQAPNREKAIAVMNALYDDNWAIPYDSSEAAGVERHDLSYIEPGT